MVKPLDKAITQCKRTPGLIPEHSAAVCQEKEHRRALQIEENINARGAGKSSLVQLLGGVFRVKKN